MSNPQLSGVTASVHDRLKSLARTQKTEINNLRLRYANERLLYRLSCSPHQEKFVLKGATLFAVWTGVAHRPTRDMDLLGHGDPSETALIAIFQELCEMGQDEGVEEDGLVFVSDSVRAHTVRDEEIYEGIKLQMKALLGHIEIPMSVDIGFGDVITPAAGMIEIPTLLKFAAPRLKSYPRETAIAEKFENMINRGMGNSRLKDYFDIWYLAIHFDFDGQTLSQALVATCQKRQTPLPVDVPEALREYCEDEIKQEQWQGFLRTNGIKSVIALPEVGQLLREFLLLPLEAANNNQRLNAHWRAGEEWFFLDE